MRCIFKATYSPKTSQYEESIIYQKYSSLIRAKMSEQETIHIRVELEGEAATQFNFVKEKLGLKNSAEVVRFLISDAAKREKEAA